MKKILILLMLLGYGVSQAQLQAKDTTKYDYIGYTIDSTLYNGDKSYFNKTFSINALVEKVMIDSDDSSLKEFNKGFDSGLRRSFDFGQRLLDEIGESGSFDFLRSSINEKGEYHLLFRLNGEDGLNYHDFLVEEYKGKTKIVDGYFFISGEYMSKTLRDTYKSMLARKPSLIDKIMKKTVVDDSNKVLKIKSLTAQGDFKKAYNLYESLSSDFKKQKSTQLIGLSIASSLDEATYQKIIKKYEESFPNDPSLYLVSIDGEFMRGNYNKVFSLINKLDNAVGGDDFLDLYRANTMYLKGDMNNATKYANRLLVNYPFYPDSYTTLMSIYIDQKKYIKAINTLADFYTTFELDKEEMKEAIAEDYPEFVKTKEYKDWLNQ